MGGYAGVEPTWAAQTNAGRTHIATKGVVQSGLVLNLDAGVSSSYPGTGNTWYDLSGNGRNYTFGSGITWNSSGYFSCDGTGVFTGPASNTFGFSSSNEHTIEAYAKVGSTSDQNTFFYWEATPSTGSDTRGMLTHLTWSDSIIYYDVGGCCGATQRIYYVPSDITSGIKYFTWRTRTDITPYRQFFINTNSEMNSGENATSTSTWNLTTQSLIADSWIGEIYTFRVYNRALTAAEIQQNYNATKSRYGL